MYNCAGVLVVALGDEVPQRYPAEVELNLKILLRYGGAKRVFLYGRRDAARVCSLRSHLASEYSAQHGQRLGPIVDSGGLLQRGSRYLAAIGSS